MVYYFEKIKVNINFFLDKLVSENSKNTSNPNPNSQIYNSEYFGSFTDGAQNINIVNTVGGGEVVTKSTIETFD